MKKYKSEKNSYVLILFLSIFAITFVFSLTLLMCDDFQVSSFCSKLNVSKDEQGGISD